MDLFRSSDLKRAEVCRKLGIDYRAFSYFLKSRHPELITSHSSRKNSDYAKASRKETTKIYRKALKLCEESDLTYKEIAEKTGVSLSGLKTFIRKHHRDVLLRRQGLEMSKRMADSIKLRNRETGQSLNGYERYKEAISACDSLEFLELSVAEIAAKFKVSATGLLAQLRSHYPEIIERREKARVAQGYADNRKRGARKVTSDEYAKAIELLRHSSKTIMEVAADFDVTYSGLRHHLLTYHKDVVALRRERRELNEKRGWKEIESFKVASREPVSRYDEAIERLRDGNITVESVANDFGFVPESLRTHIKKYHPELANKFSRKENSDAKYAAALKEVNKGEMNLKEIAEKHGLVYNSFTAYLRRKHAALPGGGLKELKNLKKQKD